METKASLSIFWYGADGISLYFLYGVAESHAVLSSRRIERTMVKAMCGMKLLDKRRDEDLIGMLASEESVQQLARVNGDMEMC